MELVSKIIYWTIYAIVGGFVTLAFISMICGMVKSIVLNIKEHGSKFSEWDYMYNAFEGITKDEQ